jgi:putative phosphoribosyl transferase
MAFYYTSVDEDELSFALDESLVAIAADDVLLEAYLATHPEAREAVLLADARPCSRDNRAMRFIAEALQEIGLATLQVDLFTEDEASAAGAGAEQIELLARRLAQVIAWLQADRRTAALKLGYFGQGAGAAAAFVAAAQQPGSLATLVAVNGALDLAGTQVAAVDVPVLLLVGTADQPALEINERARLQLKGERQLALVAGGADLLAEAPALLQVARLARGWFSRYLAR